MSRERRHGDHPNEFSREIRDDAHGGTVPVELNYCVVDLDSLFLRVGEACLRVNTAGRLWVWYEEGPIDLLAVAELKDPEEQQRSWAVTKALALRAGLAGFKVVRFSDGRIEGERLDGERFSYGNTRGFVLEEIGSLFGARREQVAL